MAGVEGLDDDPARLIAPPAPARHLRQDLEGPLGGPEVGDVQRCIGGDDADERNLREVVSLGDHLRADEDVDLPPVETPEDPFRIAPPGGRVAVHPGDAGLGEELSHLLFRPVPFLRRGCGHCFPGIPDRRSGPLR